MKIQGKRYVARQAVDFVFHPLYFILKVVAARA